MADVHITQDMLDAVSRGELPSSFLAEIGLQHLLALCPHCRAEIQDWQKRRGGSDAATLHLLPALVQEQAHAQARKRDAAERDLRHLLRLSFDDRLDRIRRAHTRFRGEALAELLLEKARQHIPAEPRTVYELAESAQAVLRHTPASPLANVLSVRAALFSGNSLRAQGNLQAAERRFAFTRSLITLGGVTDTLVYAEAAWFEGTLRKDQRRFAEAEELLMRAITLYRMAGETASSLYPLVTLGLLHYDRQEYRQALQTFQSALCHVQPETEPRLFCSIHHNLTMTLCELGEHHAAAEALEAGAPYYAAGPDAYTQTRVAWVEGKVALGFGHLSRAELAFRSVRDGFLAAKNGYDAAMVSLDLSLVYMKQGRASEVRKLAEEMHAIFESQEVHREALAALLLFQQAAREERLTVDRIETFIVYLKRARNNPSFRFRE